MGSSYGGYKVDIDSINDGDTILDLGVGTDYSFSESLYEIKKVNVIAVDPTEKSLMYNAQKKLPYVTFINKAVYTEDNQRIKLHKNLNPSFVSDSIDSLMIDVGNSTYEVDTISITTLIDEYSPSLIKMDIESAEYLVYQQCLGIKQICLETHDYRTSRDNSRDLDLIQFFMFNQYKIIYDENHTYSFLRGN